MLNRNEIKTIVSLKSKSKRQDNRSFVVEGYKMVEELLKSDYQIIKLIALDTYVDFDKLSVPPGVSCERVKMGIMSRISKMNTAAPVLAWVKMPEQEKELDTRLVSLMIDDIQDPGNLGTIIRTAHWFGFQQLVLSPNSVDLYNNKVLQASMGAAFKMHICYTDLLSAAQEFKAEGHQILGTYLEGDSIYDYPFDSKSLFVLGNEGHGISKTLEASIDQKINIPSFAQGIASESLNIASAAAVICSEIRRKVPIMKID